MAFRFCYGDSFCFSNTKAKISMVSEKESVLKAAEEWTKKFSAVESCDSIDR
jgi:hypothetical protein